MLKTFSLTRQYVLFDAANKEHRLAYRDFIKTNSWSNTKFKFILEEPYLDLPSCINFKLVQYYLDREFVKKTHDLPQLRSTIS